MISDIVEIAHDLADLGNDAGNTIGKVSNALSRTEKVKSIAEKAKRSVMMYKVLLSGGIREIELATKINKYLENMYSCFTLLVLGYNPTTSSSDNSGLNSIISSVSAESFGSNVTDQKTLKTQEAAFAEASREISFGNEAKTEESSKPRIGRSASISREADDFDLGYDTGHAAGFKLGEQQAKKDLTNGKGSLFKAGMEYALKEQQNTKSKNEILEAAFADRVKAANKGEPTIINLNVTTAAGSSIRVPIAIKCNMYAIGTEELRLLIESGISGKATSFLRRMKWRSGEISTLAWIFGTDLAERDKKLYSKLGRNPFYIELQKRKMSSKAGWWKRFLDNLRGKDMNSTKDTSDKAFEISGYRGDIPPTSALVATKEDIVSATRLNISHFTKNEGFVAKFMQDAFLLCLGIVDTDLEQVSFFFMGYKEPFVVTFKELENKGDNPDEDLYKAIATLSKKV